MDNIFVVLMDSLRMIGVSEECVSLLKGIFIKAWMSIHTKDLGINCEKIPISDNRWNKVVLRVIMNYIVGFMR